MSLILNLQGDWIVISVFNTDESSGLLGRGRRKKTVSLKVYDQSDETEQSISDNADSNKQLYKVNQEGRYICHLCEKTFKTVSDTFVHAFVLKGKCR